MNAGGLYGKARPENFPDVNDYRNPVIAEGMKNLKYVNMFNRGINRIQTILKENGNKPAIFDISKISVFEVAVNELFVEDTSANVPVTITVSEQVSEQVSELINTVDGEMTRTEIMNRLGVKSRPYFMNNYIKEAFDKGVIELTQPDKPNSPTQKYRLTEKGKHLKSD